MGKQIIFCNCRGELLSEYNKNVICSLLNKLPVKVVELIDLCGVCVSDPNEIATLFEDNLQTLCIACHPRAVTLLLKKSGVNPGKDISFINLREASVDSVTEELNQFVSGLQSSNGYSKILADTDWNAWYPVIDEEKCTSCGQCAEFCLFGVYENVGKSVKVTFPQVCKYNCPACGRICPQMAIVFPKYKQGGAISGSDTFDEQKEHERLQRDTETILGDDIYLALERRKRKRRSIIKAEAMKAALDERSKAESGQKCSNGKPKK